jgi:PAS domain S-box-containing protein
MGRQFLLRPMASLLAAARQWRAGNFTAQARLSGGGEFALLGKEFDRMASELARREAERDQALEAARESEAKLRAVVESLPFEFWVIDAGGRYVLQNPVSRASWGDRIGKRPEDTDTPAKLLEFWRENNRRALAGEIVRTEQSWQVGGETRHVEKIIAPILAGDRVLGAVGLNIDVTERHRAEERQRLLVAELNHRVRNMLATIGAIVRLTLTDNRPIEEARDVLRDRLDALASTYDLLTESKWRSARLSTIAANELLPYGTRARVEGADVMLTPQAAQTIGMILHELATNAAKYGALSTNAGRVDLTCRRIASAAGATLELVWAESAGPSVSAPERRGFGRNILEEAAVRQLKARVDVKFCGTGLVYRLRAPLASLEVQPGRSNQS